MFFLLVIFAIDRISKIYILNILENKGVVDIYLTSFINLIFVWNKGIGFGFLSFENNIFYNSITILIIIINILLLYFLISSKGFRSYSFLMILGGSLGNLFDRLYYSAVPDFIDLNYNGFHWFVFNFADIFISIGIICLIFDEILNNKNKNVY